MHYISKLRFPERKLNLKTKRDILVRAEQNNHLFSFF